MLASKARKQSKANQSSASEENKRANKLESIHAIDPASEQASKQANTKK